jgi:hypothetical protein
MAKPRDVEADAQENERVRIARIRDDAKLPMAERLDQTLRWSKLMSELADAGRAARKRVRS